MWTEKALHLFSRTWQNERFYRVYFYLPSVQKIISNLETTFSKWYLLYQPYKFKDLSVFDEVWHCNSHYQESAENISCRSDRSRIEVCHSSEIWNETLWHVPTVTYFLMRYACLICIPLKFYTVHFSLSLLFTASQAGSMEPPWQRHQVDHCKCF